MHYTMCSRFITVGDRMNNELNIFCQHEERTQNINKNNKGLKKKIEASNLASFRTARTLFWRAKTSPAAFFPASTPANTKYGVCQGFNIHNQNSPGWQS